MNIASVGPLVCVWLDSRAARQCAEAKGAGRWLAWKSLQLSLVGVVFGLAIGGLRWLQYRAAEGSYASVLAPFKSRLMWGVAEYVFFRGAHCRLRRLDEPGDRKQAWGSDGFVHLSRCCRDESVVSLPALFTLIGKASAGHEVATGTISSAMFRKLIVSGEVPAVTVHFLLASFAVAGGALMFRHWRDWQASPLRTGIWGGRIALVATLLQIPVGIWLTVSVPATAQQELLGGNLLSLLFAASMLGVMWMLHQLAAVSFGDVSPRALLHAVLTMLAVVILMTAVLRMLYW